MKSGATESSFYYLSQYYTFPENVDVQRTTHEIVKSNKNIKLSGHMIIATRWDTKIFHNM